MRSITERLFLPRCYHLRYPFGHALGEVANRSQQLQILMDCLNLLENAEKPGPSWMPLIRKRHQLRTFPCMNSSPKAVRQLIRESRCTSWYGLRGTSKTMLLSEVIRQLSLMVVIITESYEKAEQLQEDEGFLGRKVFDCSLSGTPCLMTIFTTRGTCWENIDF